MFFRRKNRTRNQRIRRIGDGFQNLEDRRLLAASVYQIPGTSPAGVGVKDDGTVVVVGNDDVADGELLKGSVYMMYPGEDSFDGGAELVGENDDVVAKGVSDNGLHAFADVRSVNADPFEGRAGLEGKVFPSDDPTTGSLTGFADEPVQSDQESTLLSISDNKVAVGSSHGGFFGFQWSESTGGMSLPGIYINANAVDNTSDGSLTVGSVTTHGTAISAGLWNGDLSLLADVGFASSISSEGMFIVGQETTFNPALRQTETLNKVWFDSDGVITDIATQDADDYTSVALVYSDGTPIEGFPRHIENIEGEYYVFMEMADDTTLVISPALTEPLSLADFFDYYDGVEGTMGEYPTFASDVVYRNGMLWASSFDGTVASVELREPQVEHQPGDANMNGVVDGEDFNIWIANIFQRDKQWTDGDFNGDTVVDISDFNIWNDHRFVAATAPVNEPVASSRPPRAALAKSTLAISDYLADRSDIADLESRSRGHVKRLAMVAPDSCLDVNKEFGKPPNVRFVSIQRRATKTVMEPADREMPEAKADRLFREWNEFQVASQWH